MDYSTTESLFDNITWTTGISSTVGDPRIVGALDQPIAPGLRLWMLMAMIFGILLMMMIIVCCFVKIRIPRTKREIELDAAQRRKKKLCSAAEIHTSQRRNRTSTKVIVMGTLPAANQSLLSASSGGMEGDFDGAGQLQDSDQA